MSDLPLNPPILLLVIGLPGAGKSFFARQFSEMYNLPYVSENQIRFELFETATFSDNEQRVVHNISRMMLDNLLKTHTSLIYEVWSISGRERLELAKTLHKIGYKMLIIWVQTDEPTAKIRSGKRDRRRPDDKFSHELEARIFDQAVRSFQKPSHREQFLVISGKFAYANQQRAVVRRLVSVYGGNTLSEQPQHVVGDINSIRRSAAVPQRDYLIRRTPPSERQ